MMTIKLTSSLRAHSTVAFDEIPRTSMVEAEYLMPAASHIVTAWFNCTVIICFVSALHGEHTPNSINLAAKYLQQLMAVVIFCSVSKLVSIGANTFVKSLLI